MAVNAHSSLPFFLYRVSFTHILCRFHRGFNTTLSVFQIYYLNNFCANSVRYTRQLRHIWPPSVSI